MPKKETLNLSAKGLEAAQTAESREDEVFAEIDKVKQRMKVEDRGLPEDYMTNDEIDVCFRTLSQAIKDKDPLGIHSALSGLDLLQQDTKEKIGKEYLSETFDADIDALEKEAEKAYGGPIEFEGDPEQGIKQARKDMAEMQGSIYSKLSEKVVAGIKKIDFFKKHPKLGKAAVAIGVTGLAVFALGSKGLVPEAEASDDFGDDFDAKGDEPEEGEKASFPIRVELSAGVDTENVDLAEAQEAHASMRLIHKEDNPYGEGVMNSAKYYTRVIGEAEREFYGVPGKEFEESFFNKEDGNYHFGFYDIGDEKFILCTNGSGGLSENFGEAGEYNFSQYYNPETDSFIIPKESVEPLKKYFINDYNYDRYKDSLGSGSFETFLRHYEENLNLDELEEPTEDEIKKWLVDDQRFELMTRNNPYYENFEIDDVRESMYHVLKAFDEASAGETDQEMEQKFIEHFKNKDITQMSEAQKVLMLQYIGNIFSKNYDTGMLEAKGKAFEGEIPLSAFIKGGAHLVKTGEEMPVGVCRHINTRIATVGKAIFGMDTFAADVTTTGPHSIAGLKSKETGNIIFIDYGKVIDTGTADYEKAQAVHERISGAVRAAGSHVTDEEGRILTNIQSRAGRDIYEAGQIERPAETVEKDVITGEIIHEKGLDIKVTPEKQQIKLDNDKLVLAYTHFDRTSDPYNSLAQLHGLSVGRRFGGKHKELSIGTAIFQKQIKDLGNGVVNDPEILARIGGQYANRADLSENLSLGFAAAAEASAIYNLKSGDSGIAGFFQGLSSFEGQASYGARLNYFDPENPFQFHIGAKQDIEFTPRNIQGFIDAVGPRVTSTELEAGAKIDIAGKAEVDISGEFSKTDFGKVLAAKADVKAGGFRVSGEYSKTKSDLFFVPNDEHGKLAITKENIPFLDKAKGALTIFGAFDKKNFGGPAGTEAKKEFGVKAIITFE